MSLRPFTHYINLLARYLRPQWRATTLMAVLLIASIGLQLLNPQILRVFIDAIFTHGLSDVLIMASLLYLSIALLKEGISMAAHYLSEKVAWTATNQLRTDLLAHVLKLDLAFHPSTDAAFTGSSCPCSLLASPSSSCCVPTPRSPCSSSSRWPQ